jgi:hypothetical protein
MRRPIVFSLIMAGIVLMAGFSTLTYSQSPTPSDTPTFYRLVPGTYVNGYPRFTVTYPKDWVEEKPSAQEIFRVASPDPTFEEKFMVNVFPSPQPLDKSADNLLMFFRNIAKDVAVVADNPFRLGDGTPAREVEIKMIMNNLPLRFIRVAAKKGDMYVHTGLGSRAERIGDGLKAFCRSLRFEPDKDEPVNVPGDIREFLDQWCSDLVAHDLAKVMSLYSDRFLNSGSRKRAVEEFLRPLIGKTTSQEVGITDFVSAGDRAYLAGFVIVSGTTRLPLAYGSIIKENGQWKFYGNQRNPAP